MNQNLPLAEKWIRDGDALRDAGFPGKAAEAYRRAVDLAPELTGIHVQLGNMLKDAGRYAESEKAYRGALALGADASDTYVQLGRALRLDGRRDAALEAFTAALKADGGSRDALRELIALGESWTAQRHTRLGASAISEVVAALDDVRRTLTRIERTLPEVASLASIPPSRWDLWRRLWQVPPAPDTPLRLGLLVLVESAPLPVVLNCLASIAAQRHAHLVAGLITADPASRKALEQRAMQRTDRFFVPEEATLEGGAAAAVHAALESPSLVDTSWVAIAIEPVVLDPMAAGWLAAAVAPGHAVAAFCDEDTLLSRPDAATGAPPVHGVPWLKGAADPELLDAGLDLGRLIVVRRDVLAHVLVALGSAKLGGDGSAVSWWPDLHRRLACEGEVEHVQKVLVSRQEMGAAGGGAISSPMRSLGSVVPQAKVGVQPKLHVMVPTRDRVELLRPCIEALRSTADVPGAIAITVIDNGSCEASTAAFLDQGQRQGWFDVLARNEPFNWSRLNNAAAARSTAPIVVFANNDIEMISAGWDTRLRHHLLERPEIGAVGARLLYPDRTVQHAGIVLGIGPGGSEHEGRGAKADDPGPNDRFHLRRSVAAVTGAFLACRRADFEAVGGFDADDLGIWFSDVDFCLKLTCRSLRVLYEPAIEALHHESKSLAAEFDDRPRAAMFEAGVAVMRQRWGEAFEHDPYFNTHYARWGTPFAWLRPPVGGNLV